MSRLLSEAIADLLGPRASSIRTAQAATWATYAAAVLTALVLGATAVRGTVHWKAAVDARAQLKAEQADLSELMQVFRGAGSGPSAGLQRSCWLSGVPELAARLERGAGAQGVRIVTILPDQQEAEEPAESGPGPDVKLKSQKISIKAHGPYAGSLKWMRWMMGPGMPIKLESVVLSPQSMPSGAAHLSMDIRITLYSKNEAET